MSKPFSRTKSPSLNALRAFEAAARYQSFSRAADELNVTAGAIAQQVKLLEDWIGCPLFQRSAQGIKLTKEAHLALPILSKAFDQLSDAVAQLRRLGKPKEITIAALPSIALLWLSPRLPRLSALLPEYVISVTALEHPPNFQRDNFDMAFFYMDKKAMGPTIISLAPDELLPVCSPTLLKKANLFKGTLDLRSLPLLHDVTWRHHWQSWLDFAGFIAVDAAKGPVFSIYSLALQSAIDGAGVLIGRSTLVNHALESGQLVAPFDRRMPAPDELCLLLPDGSPLAVVQESLLQCLQT
ncbi:MAG: LysR family transcriptional regulator [Paralcaligenes sp.]